MAVSLQKNSHFGLICDYYKPHYLKLQSYNIWVSTIIVKHSKKLKKIQRHKCLFFLTKGLTLFVIPILTIENINLNGQIIVSVVLPDIQRFKIKDASPYAHY